MVFPGRREPDDIFTQGLALSFGTSVLERYVSRIDYKQQRLHLWRHLDEDVFVENPWRDLGFALTDVTDGFSVHVVWLGTEAADAEIEAVDRVLAIDGLPLTDLSWDELVELRNRFEPGLSFVVDLARAGREPWQLTLPVVDWLPEYGPEAASEAAASE